MEIKKLLEMFMKSELKTIFEDCANVQDRCVAFLWMVNYMMK